MKKIAIIGECMIELNGKPFAEMWQTFGGDTLNSAIYLARSASQHIEVNYVTAMGTDPLSKGIIQRWHDENINTQWVLSDPTRQPGLYLIQLDDSGERTFLYWRDQSAARYMMQQPNFEALIAQLHNVDMVYLSGISLAILPKADRQRLLDILETLSMQGVEIAFDSNYRPALWPNDDMQTVQRCYQRVLSFCSLALVTFDDEQVVWKDSSTHECLSRLAKAGVKQAVIKLGKEGCLYQNFSTMDSALLVETTPVVNVVDTTSAGDSFNAGFLSGYLLDLPAERSCQRGNLLAGAVIQHQGAIVAQHATTPVTSTFNTLD
ncbi:sugar kinase [Vibrio sp. 99-8-1]|uniref:sugar kinase n=1 Tax=Vibrio sp. 99-8-1 TaxID=2607602 RepID=UPI001493DAA1|nr:sugar kinase [Vibrio sp. 99-8-1]NOI65705.1 sugar kinase [Vibrio sp. 99-8-1]